MACGAALLSVGRRRSRRPQIKSANLPRLTLRPRSLLKASLWAGGNRVHPDLGDLNARVHDQFRTTSTEHLA